LIRDRVILVDRKGNKPYAEDQEYLLCHRPFPFFRSRKDVTMKGISKTLIPFLAMFLVAQPVLSWAGTGSRIIPLGKVSLLQDGREVNQFHSEMPLPEGSLMLCKGSCMVQTQGIQLVAADSAVFAMAESAVRWDLTVKSGQVDFAIRTGAKPISFHTPHDSIQAERAIVPASGAGMARGSLMVTETESVLTLQEGALQVMSPDGTQLLQPGQAIRLAQTQTTPPQTKEKEEKKDKGGAVVAGAGAGGTTPLYGGLSATTWTIIGVGVAAGIAAGVAVGASGGSDSGPVSGF
jgi:hypothetical protein